ncbi:MAG: hypothetical protein U0Q55_10665 [Vicinamibacterales bacterium]
MQQRQPRLGDILDDYCPRERRLTNHVVVAMIGDDVKQTRCTTCDADHEYKHAAIPRQRKKPEESALYAQVLAGVAPKRIVPPPAPAAAPPAPRPVEAAAPPPVVAAAPSASRNPIADFDALFQLPDAGAAEDDTPVEEHSTHRRLIRAQLPRHEGQVATTRPATDFTIRQPNPGRPKRFGGARPARGGSQFQGGRSATGNGNGNGQARGNANGNVRGGGQRQGGRPQGGSRPGNRQGGGGGRNRSR